MSSTNGRPTGPLPAELDELAAESRATRLQADALWEQFQKAKATRLAWQEAEFTAIQAGKRYAAALDAAYEARKGQRSG